MIVCVGGEQITENLAMVQPILCVHSTFYLAKYGLVCTLYHRMYPRIPTKKILSYKILDTEYLPPPHFRMFYSSRSHLSKNGSVMRNNSGAPSNAVQLLILIVYLLQIIMKSTKGADASVDFS